MMAETVLDQIVAELKRAGASYYPSRGELRNVRVVGHTPKSDHYIYDIVMDFAEGSERLAAKVYRSSKCGMEGARGLAKVEAGNLERIHAIFQRRRLAGVPRPLGDFTHQGAVVAEKLVGLPVQSIIMKTALLPGYAARGILTAAARQTGAWLKSFHRATADMPEQLDAGGLLADLEKLCENCCSEGLDDAAAQTILSGSRAILARSRNTLPASAVLCDFTPLNVIITDNGIGFSDFAKTKMRGSSYHDAATFLACVEVLEKYPFCRRTITAQVQQEFLAAYGVTQTEQGILGVLKMRALLAMFAQGRNLKESAVRKKVMWATVMRRFIQQAAQRSLAPAA
jgi:hypothetical protein